MVRPLPAIHARLQEGVRKARRHHLRQARVTIGKVNVDENDEVVSEYGIRNIPTILLFKDGQLVDKQVGAAQKGALAEKIDKLL